MPGELTTTTGDCADDSAGRVAARVFVTSPLHCFVSGAELQLSDGGSTDLWFVLADGVD